MPGRGSTATAAGENLKRRREPGGCRKPGPHILGQPRQQHGQRRQHRDGKGQQQRLRRPGTAPREARRTRPIRPAGRRGDGDRPERRAHRPGGRGWRVPRAGQAARPVPGRPRARRRCIGASGSISALPSPGGLPREDPGAQQGPPRDKGSFRMANEPLNGGANGGTGLWAPCGWRWKNREKTGDGGGHRPASRERSLLPGGRCAGRHAPPSPGPWHLGRMHARTHPGPPLQGRRLRKNGCRPPPLHSHRGWARIAGRRRHRSLPGPRRGAASALARLPRYTRGRQGGGPRALHPVRGRS